MERGFPVFEFENRLEKVQKMMYYKKLDALFFTTEPNFSYFTGFRSQFWQSPTRPWYLIVPLKGKPIAIIPEIGFSGMRSTWIDDILTWSSPCKDDDGISLVSSCINNISTKFGRVGGTLGLQSTIRMPFNNFCILSNKLKNKKFVDISLEIHKLRSIKSSLEINKIAHVCKITDEGFSKLPSHIEIGKNEIQICKKMRIDLLKAGADNSPYLISGSGQGGYDSIIMGPSKRIIREGDVMVVDTGTILDGYFSDFDRNYAIGYANEDVKKAHICLYNATEAGFNAAKPGNTTSDIYRAMLSIIEKESTMVNNVGRLGHGLGIELTEWPSNTFDDNTLLYEGMVLTLEPGMFYLPGKYMVHEENIAITEQGTIWLSKRIEPEIKIV